MLVKSSPSSSLVNTKDTEKSAPHPAIKPAVSKHPTQTPDVKKDSYAKQYGTKPFLPTPSTQTPLLPQPAKPSFQVRLINTQTSTAGTSKSVDAQLAGAKPADPLPTHNSPPILFDFTGGEKPEESLFKRPFARQNLSKLLGDTVLNKPWTKEEAQALNYYQLDGFEDINFEMRANTAESASAAFVRSALEKSMFSKPVTVYRGVNVRVFDHLQLGVGTIISDRAFLSTSRDPYVAYHVSTGNTARSEKKSHTGLRGLVFEIPLTKAQKGIDMMLISKESYYDDEQEVLLPANTHLRVDGIKQEDGVAFVQTTVLTDVDK